MESFFSSAPAANYHQCALIPAGSTRLHIAGQLGIDGEGMVAESTEEQLYSLGKPERHTSSKPNGYGRFNQCKAVFG